MSLDELQLLGSNTEQGGSNKMGRMTSAERPTTPEGATEASALQAAEQKGSTVPILIRTLIATTVATMAAFSLFLLSRWIFEAPFHSLNLAEAFFIPIIVALPITHYIFRQADRLAAAKVALVQQAQDNERHRLLINELNHRVKNTLATVMSITAQTARRSSDLQSFLTAFNGRMTALSAAHSLLSRESWNGISLNELSTHVLTPYGAAVELHGPEILLRPSAAVSLSLVLHELATNAAKYGALAEDGIVSLTWEAGIKLRMEWRESGGPLLSAPPERLGFGSRLIEQVVVRELEGTCHLEFPTEGLICKIAAPLQNISPTSA